MEDATNGSIPKEGLECQKTQKLLQWWSEVTGQSDKPPPPLYDVLMNYGVDPKLANELCGKVVKNPCDGIDDKKDEDNSKVEDNSKEEDSSNGVTRGSERTIVPSLLTEYVQWQQWPGESFNLGTKILETVLLEDEWPPEEDILGLMDAALPDWEKVVQLCLQRQTSARFLETVCTKALYLRQFSPYEVPDPSKPGFTFVADSMLDHLHYTSLATPALRPAFDHDCVVGVKTMLPNLSSLVVNGTWKISAMAELFVNLLETADLDSLEVKGDTLVGEEAETECPFSTASAAGTRFSGSIGTLVYHSNRLAGKSGGGVDELVSRFMKRLLKLNKIEFRGDLEVATPQVIELLQRPDSTLRQLSLCGLVAKPGLYYGNFGFITSVQPLLQLLEALKGNDTLKSLHLKQLEDDDLPACQEKLAEVLQEGNTTLSEVQINGNFCGGEGHYYLRLNKAGRGVARDPKTTVSELVGLLLRASFPVDHLRRRDSFHELLGLRIRAPLPMDDDRQEIPFDIAYGLLRELPGMWSQQKKSRKRKLGDMAEGGAYLYNGPAFKSGGNGR